MVKYLKNYCLWIQRTDPYQVDESFKQEMAVSLTEELQSLTACYQAGVEKGLLDDPVFGSIKHDIDEIEAALAVFEQHCQLSLF